MTKSSLGPDPSGWSNAKMTGVGLSIAGAIGGAMAAVLVNAMQANQRPPKVYSAKQVRLTNEEVHAVELHLSSLLLKHRIGQVGERDRKIAELEETLAYERYLNSRRS